MEKLVKWTIDFDLSPDYSTAMPDLFKILQELVPSDRWEQIERDLTAECKQPTA